MSIARKLIIALSVIMTVTLCTVCAIGHCTENSELPLSSKAHSADTEEGIEKTSPTLSQSFKVTFKDGEEILSETNTDGENFADTVPVKDFDGNDIIAWVNNGVRIDAPDAAIIEKDTVFTVWKAPEAISDSHKAYISALELAFRPDDFLTRAEFCLFYNAAFTLTDNGCSRDFTDVTDGTAYAADIKKLVSSGIINGYPDATFRPSAPMSRAEFITAICKAYKAEETDGAFSDTASHWANKQIMLAAANGWMSGYPDGRFDPDATVSRAEAVAVFNRLLGRSAAASMDMLTSGNVCPFYDVPSFSWYYADIMEAVVPHTASGTGAQENWLTFDYINHGLSGGINDVGANGCYVDENGQFRHGQPYSFTQFDAKTYFINSAGLIDYSFAGLNDIGGAMYYFQADHSVVTDGYFEQLYFGADSKYTCGDAELDALVDQALSRCTNSSMTQSEKLRAAYLYLRDNCKYLKRPHHPRGTDDFVNESASFMFKNMRGNCYCYTACFLLMARRLGYQNAYAVSGGVGRDNSNHAWVMINSNIFDPELEYAYRYRYATKKYYNLFNMSVNNTPFTYYFPEQTN